MATAAAFAVPLIASLISSAAPALIQKFFPGKEAKTEQIPTMSPEKQQLLKQLFSGIGGQGGALEAGLGNITNLLRGEPEAFEQFEAPLLRQFQEQIIPGIAERFAGADALESSGFRQALGQAGAGLTETLGAQRAGLQQSAFGNLANLFGLGLGTQEFGLGQRPATPGFGESIAPGLQQLGGQFGKVGIQELIKFLRK